MKRMMGCVLILVFIGTATAETIPDFTLPGIAGEPFLMGRSIGEKIYVIDFWATWCQPCKTLLKRLQEIKDRDSEVEVLAISIDDASAQAMAVNYVQGKRFNSLAAGKMKTVTRTYTIAGDWNRANCHIVAFMQGADKGIYQGIEADLPSS